MGRIIFAGTPENAARTLEALVGQGIEVALVITREDALVGRKRVLTASPVAVMAESLGIPVLKSNKIGQSEEDAIRDTGAKLAIVVAYGAILRASTISLLDNGWFNLHYSVLPRWRGASPVQSALLAGDESTGVTLFKIDEGLDTGLVAGTVETTIEPGENSARLLSRLTELGITLAFQELPRLFAGIHAMHEQIGEPTYAPKFSREDARISLTDTPRFALAKVLAFNPEPIAWLEFNGQPLRLFEARESDIRLAMGEFSTTKSGVLFGLADGKAIELLQVQPAGKPRMPATDWFRGTKDNERTVS